MSPDNSSAVSSASPGNSVTTGSAAMNTPTGTVPNTGSASVMALAQNNPELYQAIVMGIANQILAQMQDYAQRLQDEEAQYEADEQDIMGG